jgi:small neutral amino acid transporter SnatA (MarC family)
VGVLISILIAIVNCWATMRLSTDVIHVLGETSIHVVGRVMGMILAVQFVLNGVGSYYQSLVHS